MPYYEEKVITMITVHMVLLYGRLGKRGAHEKIVDFANFSAPSCRNLTGKAQYRNRHPWQRICYQTAPSQSCNGILI